MISLLESNKSFSSLIIFLIILVDQISKILIIGFGIDTTCNTGFAFGIGQGSLSWLISILVLICVLYSLNKELSYSSRERKRVEKFPSTVLALSLILAGGFSNLIDRVIRGCVVDFIDLKFWPAFNVADAAITAGVVVLIFYFLRKEVV